MIDINSNSFKIERGMGTGGTQRFTLKHTKQARRFTCQLKVSPDTLCALLRVYS